MKKLTHKKGTRIDKYDTAKLNNINIYQKFKLQMSEKIRSIDVRNDSINEK